MNFKSILALALTALLLFGCTDFTNPLSSDAPFSDNPETSDNGSGTNENGSGTNENGSGTNENGSGTNENGSGTNENG